MSPSPPVTNAPPTPPAVPAGGNEVRLVNHFYKGGDDVDPVVKFYQTTMPENGWKWLDQTESHGTEITLRYTKKAEGCTITVGPKQWGGSMIHIKNRSRRRVEESNVVVKK